LQANVTRNGAILLGKHVACDSHDKTRLLRVVTHAHADHMTGLQQSLRNCNAVVMTPATKDLIDVLKGPRCLQRGNVKAIEYDEPLDVDGERLTLHKVDHILGAAQVLVEDAVGNRILYTGDFRLPNTPVIKSDILIAMSQAAYDKYLEDTAPGSIIFFDEKEVSKKEFNGIRQIGIPATSCALSQTGGKQVANIIILGAAVSVTNVVNKESLLWAIRENVDKRYLDLNQRSMETGFALGDERWLSLEERTGR